VIFTDTIESIRAEVAGSFVIRSQMNSMMKKLKKFEKKIGSGPLQDILLGRRKLTIDEYTEVRKKFGLGGIGAIQALEILNPAQKEYIFERMEWEWKPEYATPVPRQVPANIVHAESNTQKPE
jgi:hypothetical protein